MPTSHCERDRLRMKAMRRPSGDQSPATASGTSRFASPPTAATRKRSLPCSRRRTKSSDVPSGEKRGTASTPSVTATSSPLRICRSQTRDWPSPRSEVKATSLPSGEAVGHESFPECVSTRSRVGGCCRRAATQAPPSPPSSRPRPSAAAIAPRATGLARRGGGGATIAVGPVPLPSVASSSRSKARSRALWKRSSGAFSRQWRTSRANAGGRRRPLLELESSSPCGSSRSTATTVSASEPRWNGRSPLSIS